MKKKTDLQKCVKKKFSKKNDYFVIYNNCMKSVHFAIKVWNSGFLKPVGNSCLETEEGGV